MDQRSRPRNLLAVRIDDQDRDQVMQRGSGFGGIYVEFKLSVIGPVGIRRPFECHVPGLERLSRAIGISLDDDSRLADPTNLRRANIRSRRVQLSMETKGQGRPGTRRFGGRIVNPLVAKFQGEFKGGFRVRRCGNVAIQL